MNCGNAEQITVLSAVISTQMAQGLTADEVNILAALLNAVANNLALIAAMEVSGDSSQKTAPQPHDRSPGKEKG